MPQKIDVLGQQTDRDRLFNQMAEDSASRLNLFDQMANESVDRFYGRDDEGLFSSIRNGTIGDLSRSLFKGAIAVPESVVGLVDLATMPSRELGRFVTKSLYGEDAPELKEFSGILADAGFRPREARETLSEWMSPESKQIDQEINQRFEEDGLMQGAAEIISNPSFVLRKATEATPQMLSAIAASRMFAARIAAAATEQAIASGATKEAAALFAKQAVEKAMPQIANVSIGMEGLQQAGSMAADLSEGGLTAEEAAASLGSGLTTALMGKIGTTIGAKFGLDDVESGIATAGMRSAPPSILASTLKGAIQEGILEESGQSATEQMWQNVATGRPINEGVAQAAVEGAITGMAMGAFGGAIGSRKTVTEATSETTQASDANAVSEQLRAIADAQITEPTSVDLIAPDVTALSSLVRARLGEQEQPMVATQDIANVVANRIATEQEQAKTGVEISDQILKAKDSIISRIEQRGGEAKPGEMAFLLRNFPEEAAKIAAPTQVDENVPALLRTKAEETAPVASAEITIQPTDIQPLNKNGEPDGVFASMTTANVARDKLGLTQTHIAVPVEYEDKSGFVIRPIESQRAVVETTPPIKQEESKTAALLQPTKVEPTANVQQTAAQTMQPVVVSYEPISERSYKTEKSAEAAIKSQKIVDAIVQPTDSGFQIVRAVEAPAQTTVQAASQEPIATTAPVEQKQVAKLLQPIESSVTTETPKPTMAQIVTVDDGSATVSAPIQVNTTTPVQSPKSTTTVDDPQIDVIAKGIPDQELKPSYAGQNATNADLTALESAKQRIDSGDDAETVRRETGWFKAPDNNWRFEINDKQAQFQGKQAIIDMNEGGRLARLEDVWSHPTLFDAYPELKSVVVQIGTGDTTGITQDGKTIILGEERTDKQLSSSILHEVQHAIQIQEGFATGATSRQLAAESQRTGRAEQVLYSTQLGEIEARDVQARQPMSDERRVLIQPYSTQGIPQSDMIVSLGVNQKPVDVETVTKAINNSLGPVASTRIQIVENEASAAQLIGDRAERIASTSQSMEGFYDPKTGQTVLIANNIKPMHGMTAEQRAVWVGWHELYHRGVGVANRQKYDAILNRAMQNKSVKALGVKIAQMRGAPGIATEEAMAELAAAARTGNFDAIKHRYGIQFSKDAQLSLKQKNGSFAKLWAEVKAFLSEFFGRTPTDEEIGLVLSKTLRDAVEKETAASGPAIKASIAPTQPAANQQGQAAQQQRQFVIQDETKAQKAQRISQDDKNRIQVVQDQIEAQGGVINEQTDVRAAMDRKAGRAGSRLEDFKREITSLLKKAIDLNVDLDDVALYMYALHAPERNAYIATINPRFQDGGSGMTNAESAQIIADFNADANFANIEAIANEFKALTGETLDMLVSGGVMPADQAAAYKSAYANYVPLKGFEKADEGGQSYPMSGKGFSMPARLDRRALGRQSRAGQIIENIIVDRERAIDQVEKANVGKYLLNLIAQNPDDNLWTIDRPPQTQALTTRDGKQIVDWRTEQYDKEKEIRLLLDGEVIRIQLKDPLMIRAYNNLGAKEFGAFLNASSQINSLLRQFWTKKNPQFILINPIRDIQAGAINLVGEGGVKLAKQAVKSYAGAMRAMYAFARGNKIDPEWESWIKEYRSTGGSISFPYVSSVEQMEQELARINDRYRSMRSVFDDLMNGRKLSAAKALAVKTFNNRLFDFIEHLNLATENALRLASYKAAKELGMSKSEAARISRHVGPNFNKRGEMGPQMGAVYLFANSNIQGSAQMLHSILKSPHKTQVQGIIGALAALGMVIGMMEADDDDDTISEGEKQRNWIIKLGDEYHLTIPKPYGWSSFVDVGRSLGRSAAGKDPYIEAMRIVSSFMNNFSPVGSPLQEVEGSASDLLATKSPSLENIALTMTPTALKPIMMPALNKGGFGGPLMPDFGEGDYRPDSEKLFRSTRGTIYDKMAKWMNSATGGDQFKEGWADFSPESLKNLVNYTTGGAGRFLVDLYGMPSAALDEQAEIDTPKKVPIVKAFIKKKNLDAEIQSFYKKADEAKRFFDLYKSYTKTGNVDKAKELMQDDKPYLLVGSQVNSYKSALRSMRDYESQIDAHEDWTVDRKKAEREMIQKKQKDLIDNFNSNYKNAFSLI